MVEFSAGTVVAMFAVIEVSLMIMMRRMVTKKDLERRMRVHKARFHEKNEN